MIKLVFLTNLIVIVVCFLTGTLFLVLPKRQLHHYKNSLKILSVAYYILGLLNAFYLANLNDTYTYFYLQFINIFLTSSQIILFASTILILYNHTLITPQFILRQTLPPIVFSILYVSISFFWGTIELTTLNQLSLNFYHPSILLRLLFLLFSIFQLAYFFTIFHKEETRYKQQYKTNTSKLQLKPRQIKETIYSAFFVVILSFFYQFFAVELYEIIFSLTISAFYFVFGIRYIHFSKYFEENIEMIREISEIKKEPEVTKNKLKWNDLKNSILTEKFYLEEGITLESLALKLKIGRTVLSNFINNEEGVNFNSWLNTLRIEEAKRLFGENPKLNIAEVSALIGFSEQSNFSRQFKLVTGITPSEWKKKISET